MVSQLSAVSPLLCTEAGIPVTERRAVSRHTRWVLMLAALALASCGKPEHLPEPTRAVRTLVLAPSALSFQQEYAGEIRARTESRLGFRVPGKLIERQVRVGDAVRPGQVLARLDPQDLRLADQAAQASVLGARVNAQQSEADLKRFQGLFEQGFISAAELERRSTSATAAAAQYEQAKAQAAVQGRQTQFAALLADASGVITAVEAEPGAVLAAGATVVRLAWDGPRDVVFSVPEDQVGAMRAVAERKEALRVRLWGEERSSRPARIREIAAAADPLTRTFQIKAELIDGASGQRAPMGLTAVVTLQATPEVALKLPLTALMQHQGRSAVWVLDGSSMTVKPRPVTVAAADANDVVIASGLAAGDEVVTAGVHVLTEGQRVNRLAEASGAGTPAAAPSKPSR
jgi:membrane fusion protein, multidrug efflux system